MNKKAQGLSINVVILLILAVLVLVLVIAGFMMGWNNLWGRLTGFFSTSNVDAIVTSCNLQCATQQKQEFCCIQKSIRGLDVNNPKTEQKLKCSDSQLLSKIECTDKDTLCSGYTC